ncbi:MAG TPA: SCO family protein [Acidimicrobiia bacterium]|nr:SCO family protein [Acidimicrobiia bacterium]
MARRTPGLVRLILSVLVALVLVACSEPTLLGAVRSPPLQVAAVTIPDGTDTPVPMRAADGELLLVYFGYVSCPDICPTTMADIRLALEGLPRDLAERVSVAMVTVDPERDTIDVLTGYLGHFFDRGLALRIEDTEELRRATQAFGAQFEIAEHEPGESYDVAHTAITYVIDDTGTVVVEWPFGFHHDAMTSDLKTILERKKT